MNIELSQKEAVKLFRTLCQTDGYLKGLRGDVTMPPIQEMIILLEQKLSMATQ